MTNQRDPDSVLAAWLDDGPAVLPDATRRAIATALPTTTQLRRGLFAPPRRFFPMTPLTRVALVAVLAAAVIGGTLFVLGNNTTKPSPTAATTPAPTAGSLATPSSTLDGRALNFPQPFSYRIPAGSGYVASRSGAGFYQFRVPVTGTTNFTHGVIVRPVRGGRVDPCDASSNQTVLDSAQAAMDYLATVPTTSRSSVTPMTLDGRPAFRTTLHVGAATAGCENVWLWDGEGSISQNGGRNADWQMTIVDVGLSHIAIYTAIDPSWQEISDELIASIHFDEPPPSS